MIPTLAARGRQRLLQELARGELNGCRRPLNPEPPVALASYLHQHLHGPESARQLAATLGPQGLAETLNTQEEQPETLVLSASAPGQGLELVLWLGLLLFDGALAIRELLQTRWPPATTAHRGSPLSPNRLPAKRTGGGGPLVTASIGTVEPVSC